MTAIDPFAIAATHAIRHPRPAVAFTSGALLGNGGLGAVVLVRPDAVAIHFGHNDVWDIRLAENNREQIGTFAEIFAKVAAIDPASFDELEDDPWYADYVLMTRENYANRYPRPFPCGTVVLGFDRRRCEALGYELDIANGRCRVDLLCDGEPVITEIFVEFDRDRLRARARQADGAPCQPFTRIHILPDPQTPAEFPAHVVIAGKNELGFSQVLPRVTEPGRQVPGPDHAFRLHARMPGTDLRPCRWPGHLHALVEETGPLERYFAQDVALDLIVDLTPSTSPDLPDVAPIDDTTFASALRASEQSWRAFWQRSGVSLSDAQLEAIWYRNLYFFRAAVRPGVTCPGLFANWSYAEVGSRWHGDYHMNYNTQQPFWVTFSSNHLELNLPYVAMVEHLTEVASTWARDYYQLRGAYYPHSAYPVPMTMNPYPKPDWGWEICETPWTVQGLWWHYTYSQDRDFLRQRAWRPLREACRFLADYMLRDEASGARFGDDRCHIFPTVPPELYRLRPGFQRNADCLVDLTLTRFVFVAFREACQVLTREREEAELLADIATILDRFPDYPTAKREDGPVWVSVADEDPDLVLNCPVSTMTIFPGEEHGLHSPPEELAMARRTYAGQQNEGGNELVFLNLQAARIGMLDLERFKRQVAYCTLPNGSCADLILQGKGRYHDHTPFDAMAPMGIWFENFALPAVVNECLLQSHDGIIHVFPNWPRERDAAFQTLRAVGAFLVSARLCDGEVDDLTILSEAGGDCRVHHPWPGRAVTLRDNNNNTQTTLVEVDALTFSTKADGHYSLAPIS